ncbi:tetratricopeptide repeat protein [Bdellovibrio sp. GT3]|uniref:tetratricopeptide repeat protein n=1 Tax=Bdellovibrio sp. GT3 TaxID=3136282 RepID=UPI0030EFBF25
MLSFVKTNASIGLLLTLTACAGMSTKSLESQQLASINAPNSPVDPLNVRAQADYQFIVGDVYSREGKPAQAIKFFEKVAALDPNSAAVHLRLSTEYQKTKKNKEALKHAELAVQKDGNNIEARLVLAKLYSAEKNYDKAISEYNTVLKLDPKNTDAPVYIGALYADKKEYAKAEQYYNNLLKDSKYSAPHEIHYYLGLIRLEQKGAQHEAAAEAAFKKALKSKDDYEDALVSLTDLYLKQKNRGKALALCLDFQKQHGFVASVADKISQIYIDDGNMDKAYEQFEVIAGGANSSLEAQMKMALILIKQKRHPQAIASLKHILAQSPSAHAARYYLAAVYEELGDAENAIRNFMMVPATSEHFSDSIVHAAYLLKGQGKVNQALTLTENGLKSNAGKAQMYTMYASLLDAKADYLGAARVLEKGLSKYSHNVGLLFQHALILDRLGQKTAMIEQMKKVLELEPDHVQSMSYLAFSMAEMNQQLPEAEKLARRALELNPQDGYVMDTLGWVLFKQKRFAESVQVLEKAFAQQSSASIIAEHLGDAYSMQSQTVKANAMYTKAAALSSDKKRASQIRGKIQ